MLLLLPSVCTVIFLGYCSCFGFIGGGQGGRGDSVLNGLGFLGLWVSGTACCCSSARLPYRVVSSLLIRFVQVCRSTDCTRLAINEYKYTLGTITSPALAHTFVSAERLSALLSSKMRSSSRIAAATATNSATLNSLTSVQHLGSTSDGFASVGNSILPW